MHPNMEGDDVHVKLEGKMDELFVKLDPKLYRKYIHDENGKPVLYAKKIKSPLQNASRIYVVLEAPFIILVEVGFRHQPL